MTNNATAAATTKRPKMSNLEDLEKELSQVERALQAPRQWLRGRAGMNSVRDSLASVGRRLQRSLSSSSLDIRRQNLSRRLETAQLALSSRTPLSVVQTRQQQQEPLAPVSSTTSTSSSHGHLGSQRRPSVMLASRSRPQPGLEYSLESYEAVVGGLDPSASKRKKLDNDDACRDEDDPMDVDGIPPALPPPRVLLSKSQSDSLVQVLNDSTVSGSIQSLILTPQPETQHQQAGSVLYSWGQSGLGSLHDDDAPRSVDNSLVAPDSRLGKPGSAPVISMATSATHSACTLAQGTVLTWGQNTKGVVDPFQKSMTQRTRPTLLESINNFNLKIVQVSCGYDHAAALSDQGTVLTWGSNQVNQCGHRTTQNSPSTYCAPQGLLLTGGQRAASVACGYYFTLVLTTRMNVLVCGEETITACASSRPLASSIPALQGLPLVAVAAGHHHAIVLTSSGTAYAWGLNESGCCGRPFPTKLSLPVEVHFAAENTPTNHPSNSDTNNNNPLFPNWTLSMSSSRPSIPPELAIVHAAAGADHTCFVTRSGRLLVCGNNRNRQLGLETTADKISPAQAIEHPNHGAFVSAEAGSYHTILLDSNGDVWTMGNYSSNSSKGGLLECALKGKNILSIAAGGDQTMAMAAGEGTLRRKVPITPTIGTTTTTVLDSSVLANTLEELIETMGGQDDDEEVGEQVARGVEELLQNPSVMNSVFFDPVELDEMFLQLMRVGSTKTQQLIATAIETGVTKGLESIGPENARMIYPEAVRCLLLYIRFLERPSDEDNGVLFDLHGRVVSALMEAILGLPFEGYKAFMKWATTLYSGELFVKMLVKPLLSQLDKSLKITVDNNQVAHASLSLGAVPLIVSVLQWLYKASERLGDLAKAEDFYSKSFDNIPTEALFDDLHRLKLARKAQKRPSTFLITESPFLFSPKVKQNLLQIESQVEMFKVASANGVVLDLSTGQMKLDAFFRLEIEREHMLQQTLRIIKSSQPSDLRKKLQVVFKGEEGVDAGGVTKEFFQLLSEELFDFSTGMWTSRYGDNVTWFNADCEWDIEGFELTGVLVGLAMYNSVLLDVHFPMAVYRKILGYPLGLEDMVDEELKRGFQELLDFDGGDVEHVFCLNFEVSWTDDLGISKKKELLPGGADVPVTNQNREEYVKLYTQWLLVDSIHRQWEAFERGMMRIIEGLSLDLLFRPEELKLLVVGSPELNFDSLEANTLYEGGYDQNTDVVKNFWKFIKGADVESQLKFLKFATGSSMAPIGGLGALKFKIQRAGPDSPQLPTSHTCFNTLLLPEYANYEKLEERLSRAILECEGFGLQ